MSSRPPVVAPSPSSVSRSVSLPGVSRPTLLVRCLRRGVGCPSRSSDRFRPVGHPPGGVIHKRQGTACCPTGSSPVPVISTSRTVAVFCDSTTTVAYLRMEGGTRSPLLNTLAQEILRWTESLSIRLAPQFLPGSNNILADALSRPHQLPHSEWSLNLTVFQSLRRLWPVQIDLFATSDNHRCSIYHSGIQCQQARTSFSSPGTVFRLTRSSGGHHSACSREAQGLHGDGAHTSSSTLGPAPSVLRPAPAFAGSSSDPAGPSRPLALASVSSSLPGSPSAQASCLATLQRFTRAAGFSFAVAEQSSLARRPSSRAVSQVRWSIYRAWCHTNGHSVSRPTLAKVADFL